MSLERAMLSFALEAIKDPSFMEGINSLFCQKHHTALEAAQDILDAADAGRISIQGARAAVNAILDDLERQEGRRQKPISYEMTKDNSLDDLRQKLKHLM